MLKFLKLPARASKEPATTSTGKNRKIERVSPAEETEATNNPNEALDLIQQAPALSIVQFLAEVETYHVLILSLPAVLAKRDQQIAEIDEEIYKIDHRLAELYLRRNDITAQFQAEQEKGVAA